MILNEMRHCSMCIRVKRNNWISGLYISRIFFVILNNSFLLKNTPFDSIILKMVALRCNTIQRRFVKESWQLCKGVHHDDNRVKKIFITRTRNGGILIIMYLDNCWSI